MIESAPHPYREAVEALAADLAKLDAATAHAVAARARDMIHAAWLASELEAGRRSGEPLDAERIFAELLDEAETDVAASAS